MLRYSSCKGEENTILASYGVGENGKVVEKCNNMLFQVEAENISLTQRKYRQFDRTAIDEFDWLAKKRLAIELVDNLKEPLVKKLFQIMKLPKLSSEELEKIKIEKKEQENLKTTQWAAIEEIMKKSKLPNEKIEVSLQDKAVFQNEISLSNQEKLYTIGLGPCIGITLYDPVKKQVALAHFDVNATVEDALTKLLTKMQISNNTEAKRLQVNLIGGYPGRSDNLLIRIYQKLKESGVEKFNIVMKNDSQDGYKIAIDPQKGKIYQVANPAITNQVENNKNRATLTMADPGEIRFV